MENLKAVNKRKNKLGMRRKGFIIAFLAPTLIAFCVFYLYPIITVFVTSFCKWDYTNITSPEFFGWSNLWDNYDYIFNKYPFFWEALRNSTTWAILGAVVQIPIATLIALALSRKVKGIKFVRNVYIIPNMISTAAMGIVFLQLYNPSYGIINPIIRLFHKDFTDNIASEGICFCGNDLCLHFFSWDHHPDDSGKYYGSTGRGKGSSHVGWSQWSEAGLAYHHSYDKRNLKNRICTCCHFRLPPLQRGLFPDKRCCRNLQYQLHYP